MIFLVQLRTEREYTGSFRSNLTKEIEDKFEEWVKHLPKTLWELGASNLEATEVRAPSQPLEERKIRLPENPSRR